MEQLLQLLFCKQTGRSYEIDKWKVLDLLMFATITVITINIHGEHVGTGKLLWFVSPELFSGCAHGVMMSII